jgi:hypothetical protein
VRFSRIVAAFWREATHIAKPNHNASAGKFAARSFAPKLAGIEPCGNWDTPSPSFNIVIVSSI